MRRLIVAALLVLPGSVALCADPPSYQDGVIASSIKNLQDTTAKVNETTAQLSSLLPAPDKTAGKPTWKVTEAVPPAVVAPRAMLSAPQVAAAPAPAPEPVQPQTTPAQPVAAPAPPAPPAPPTVVVNTPRPTFDITALLLALNGGIISVLTIVLPVIINNRMKDRQAAETLSAAVKNSLGIGQQIAEGAIRSLPLSQIQIPGVPQAYAPMVQYVFDHAGDEAKRFGLTPEAIADKVSAQIGLKAIDTNIALAGSPAPVVPQPLAPLPEPVVAAPAASTPPPVASRRLLYPQG